jgi:hypothetical protein
MPTDDRHEKRADDIELDDVVEARESLKRHGDALRDGSGSRQGEHPDAARDAAPREGTPPRGGGA